MKLLFAWRYFRSKKTTNAINVIAWISVLAIGVGAAALIVVLSVFNGFEDLVKNLYGDFYSDIRIAPAKGKFIQITPGIQKQIETAKGVKATSYVAEEKAVLINGECQTIVYLKGVDENYPNVNKLNNHIERGKYDVGIASEPGLVVGVGIENAACADPGEANNQLTLYIPNRGAKRLTSEDAMNSAQVKVTGSFLVQQEFDNKYAFTNLAFLQYMLNLQPDFYTSVEVKTAANTDEEVVQQNLQTILGKDFKVQTRLQQNQSLFTVMQVEKWVIYGILSLILLIAAFNMIGSLTMLVLEKQKDIAVLKAMGANNKTVQNIFLAEGLLLAGVGGIGGMLVAFLICVLQVNFKLIKLQGGTFLIDYYPVKMLLPDFLLVTLTIFIIAVLAAYIPARKASQQFFSLKS